MTISKPAKSRYGIASIVSTLVIIPTWVFAYFANDAVTTSGMHKAIGIITSILWWGSMTAGLVLWVIALGLAQKRNEFVTAIVALILNVGIWLFFLATYLNAS